MRIVHLINTLDPAAGGPPRVSAAIASAQAADGHDVTLASIATPHAAEEIQGLLDATPGIDAVKLVELPRPSGLRDKLTAKQTVGPLDELLCDAEALHMHGVWEPVLVQAAKAARRHGIKYAVRPAGMLDPWSMSQKKLKKRLALMLGYRKMLDGAAFLHALNRDEAELVGPLGLRCRVEVVPNGVFPEQYETRVDQGGFYAKHPKLDGRPFVLFMSRIHYKKGLDILAEAFAQVAAAREDVVLVVAGPEEGAGEGFKQAIESAGLSERVFVVGPIYGETKQQALVDAACFCLPSRQEGFSVAITEALASGSPVVITDACHFPEVGEVGAGKVVPLDAARVGEALIEVLSNGEAANEMGRRGRALVFERYVWPAVGQQLVKIFESV